ncbi:hypothetical protein AGOR_G00231760 [Albula goreensis]|uniref:Transmembrane protein 168 n=1 Tax=Albula goreensis TaxID=1534307 RepID=A0A8T3CEN0_9TELE|nr:hypothetical protein AGOR_G00231760 [Albula goreensis]
MSLRSSSLMCRSLRYCVSHCLYATMTRMEEVNREANMLSPVRFLGCFSSLTLLVAVCLGLYVRWEKTSEATILVIFILGLFVLGIASILYYYFSMETASMSLFHLWFGFLLGLLCFLNSPALVNDVKEETTNYLLLASAVLRTLWAVLERIRGSVRYRPTLLTSAEFLELVGFAIASTIMHLRDAVSLIVLVVALAALVVDLRMKSFLAIPNLVCFLLVTSLAFFKSLEIATNPFALRVDSDRALASFLTRGAVLRKLTVLPLGLVELTFLVLAAIKLADLELWYVVIPGFCVSAVFWVVCHTILVVTLWGFHTKLNDCQKVYCAQRSDGRSLDRVMASKGMRHFCLISERLAFFSLLSTAILAGISWQPNSRSFMSMLLLVLPLESLAHGLFHELGNCLGGTCVGYALVIPTSHCSADGQPALLPPDLVQELNLRSTGMLNSIQRFFSHHMIEPYSCDYSTAGMPLDSLQAKLKGFLELRTADGPRHDTYLVYYSGHSFRTGDLALAGGDTLRLDEVLDWWREKNGGFCSRLILVLDTENSMPWVKAVRGVDELFVAVQGAELNRSLADSEAPPPQLGDFTSEWVEFNCNPDSDVQWSEKGRSIRAAYGISKRWSDYTLHLPTGSDVTKHWKTYFPKVTYPLVYLANWCGGLNLFWVCGVFLRCFRRFKLTWFPPTILDTGQGFKLVKS